ncbi:MAG TPA: carbohydrate-binding protein [Polyangiaceae bacterium]|nr:carbohydrate-binding protein [Polyangiaceae bacterium]
MGETMAGGDPSYSSGEHGSSDWMQWPFKDWGADVVLNGHDHTYERIIVNGSYFVTVWAAAASIPSGRRFPAARTLIDTYTMNKAVVSDGPQTLQAEDAALSGAVKAANHAGYTGSGFADYVNPNNDYVEWTVNATTASSKSLDFRYSLAAAATRSLRITVNGAPVSSSLVFPVTSNWDTWNKVSVTAGLIAGANKVRATAIGSSGPNLDSLTVR